MTIEDIKKERYKKVILFTCKKCGQPHNTEKVRDVFRGYCDNCKTILVADYTLTENAIEIGWKEYEYIVGSAKNATKKINFYKSKA